MFKPVYLERNDNGYLYLTVSYENDINYILSTFMNDDVSVFGEEILEMLKDLLNNVVSHVDYGFNMCNIYATKDKTCIFNLYDAESGELIVDTKELYILISDWIEKLDEYDDKI